MCLADWMGPPSITTPGDNRDYSCDDLMTIHCFSGAVETRIYENGVLQGKAVKQSGSGEVEERQYVDGKLNGKATVLYSDSSKEMRTYKVIITTFSWLSSDIGRQPRMFILAYKLVFTVMPPSRITS